MGLIDKVMTPLIIITQTHDIIKFFFSKRKIYTFYLILPYNGLILLLRIIFEFIDKQAVSNFYVLFLYGLKTR